LVKAESDTKHELEKADSDYGYATGKGPEKFNEAVDILNEGLDKAVQAVKDAVAEVDKQWYYQDPKEFDKDIERIIAGN